MRHRLQQTLPGYTLPLGRTLAIFAGILSVLMLSVLDQTIVATALPRIVSDLGGIKEYSWVFTAYILMLTVTVPVYGRLGDAYGRKFVMMCAVGIFLAGSALCGAAQNMTELVIFRCVQGVGAGGLYPLGLAVIASIVPPRSRGRWQGLSSTVGALGTIAGAIAGGFIVDNTSWRWIFLVNIPIGGFALIVVARAFPRRTTARAKLSIDWSGAALLALGSAALLLAFSWASADTSSTSPRVVVAFVSSVVLLAAFAFVERRADSPILPFDLLRNPVVAGSTAGLALAGMVFFGVISFVPLFVQAVIGMSATSSGLVLFPALVATSLAAIVGGQVVSKLGSYRWNLLVGSPLTALGAALLWRMDVHTTAGQATRAAVVCGVGLGLTLPMFVIAVQNAVRRQRIGAATALSQFSRQMGGAIGVSVMGMIVNARLPPHVTRDSILALHRTSTALRASLASAITPVFLAAAIIAVAVWLVSLLWVKDVPMREAVEEASVVAAASPGASVSEPQ